MEKDEISKGRPLYLLTHDNWQESFELAEMHFVSKGIYYTITQSLQQYARVFADTSRSLESQFASLSLNTEKEAQWKKDGRRGKISDNRPYVSGNSIRSGYGTKDKQLRNGGPYTANTAKHCPHQTSNTLKSW